MTHTIRIEKIIHGGLGLGRLQDGMVVLTSFVLPGEEVLVNVTKDQRGYIEAEPVEILTPSPDRVMPPCPYYMQCGGCNFQHMSTLSQLAAKEDILRESLNRAGADVKETIFQPILSSPEQFHYRSRIRLKVSPQGAIGFHRTGSNSIVDIQNCLVASKAVNNALTAIRNQKLTNEFVRITREIELLQSPADSRMFCILHPYPKEHSSQFNKIVDHLSPHFLTVSVATKGRRQEILSHGRQNNFLRQDFDSAPCGTPYGLSWTPGCFSQVNAEQNSALIKTACKMAGDCRGKKTLDLFCGTGNFSIPLALMGARITGIERNTQSIKMAGYNASASRLDNMKFIALDAHKWLIKAVKRSNKFDSIILDPPRQGMGRDIVLLPELSPEKIIYISCDPATLARDIVQLQKQNYTLKTIVPVDMFPQTHHIESVALLEKN